MCEAASHPRAETYTRIGMVDPERVPLGEDYEDHLVDVPLCLKHFEAFREYARGDLTEEGGASA